MLNPFDALMGAMQAMILRAFGDTDQFEPREVPTPEPGPGEVRVRVHATSVNPVDYKIRQAGSWAGVEPPAVIGYDVAGVVDALGPGANDFAVGDEVYYTPEIFGGPAGSYAQYHVAPESIVARKPANLSFEEAAAVPLAGGTAWVAIVERLQVRPGETVLVHGGAGGVGHFAVQVAKAAGARVLATAGPKNQALLRELGVDVPIDYSQEDFVKVALRETGGIGVDAVFDTVGGDLLPRSLDCVRPYGRAAGIVAWEGDYSAGSVKNLTLHQVFLMRQRRSLDGMRTLLERGQVRPVVAEVLALEDVGKAHERLESGHGHGKLVLRVP